MGQAALQIVGAGLGQPIAEGRSGAHAIGLIGHGPRDGVGGAVGEGQVHGSDAAHRVPGITKINPSPFFPLVDGSLDL